jgi:hypothetical protein
MDGWMDNCRRRQRTKVEIARKRGKEGYSKKIPSALCAECIKG